MLGRKTLLIYLNSILGSGIGFVGIFFLARYMGSEVAGTVAVGLAVGGAARALSKMGIDKAHVKMISEGRDLGACLGTYAGLKLLLIGAVLLISLIAMGWYGQRGGFMDPATRTAVVLGLAWFVLAEVQQIAANTFVGRTFTAKSQLLTLTEQLARVPAVVVIAVVYATTRDKWAPFASWVQWAAPNRPWTEAEGSVWILGAYLAGMALALLVGAFLIWRHGYPRPRIDRSLARDYWAFALPLAPLVVLAKIAPEVDKLMLDFFWGKADVGHYFAVQRLTLLAMIIPNAVGAVFFPMMSAAAKEGNESMVGDVARTTQRFLGLIMVFVAGCIAFYAPQGIHLFLSDDFLPGTAALRWLALHALLVSFAAVPSAILMGHGRIKTVAVIGSAGIVANLTLNLLFIPDAILGIPALGLRSQGAAMATAVAQIYMLAHLSIAAHAVTGVRLVDRSLLAHLAAGALAAPVAFLTKGAWFGGLDRFWELAGAGLVVGAVYLGALLLLGALGRKDLLMLRDLLSPGQMVRYIRDELTPVKTPKDPPGGPPS